MTLPELLTVEDVRARYGCGERRARQIMREAGALAVSRRLMVRADLLDEWERCQAEASPPPPPRAVPRLSSTRRRAEGEPLAPGWWRRSEIA